MLTVTVLALIGGMAAEPQNTRVIGPNPNAATVTMGRFSDNEWRQLALETRQQAHAARVSRTSVVAVPIRGRMALADRLDRLISEGDCDLAREVANGSGQADIAREVARVCAARSAD